MMKQRCLNAGAPNWSSYGGRGIMVCERWREAFRNFLADMGERPAGKTIDRKDNDGHYEPGKCRWATASEQVRNQRSTTKKQRGADGRFQAWLAGRTPERG